MIPKSEPLDRFRGLLSQAEALDRKILPEPTAFALGTVDSQGQVAVRMLLLKAAEPEGLVFYTNHESRKGRELLAHPRAAMCFHWQPLTAQVRIEGEVAPVSPAQADAYFATRVRESQIGAWASIQSEPIHQPGDLERRLREFTARFEGQSVPRPPHWSGFRLVPQRWEFWAGRPGRLHERQVYVRDTDGWVISNLYP